MGDESLNTINELLSLQLGVTVNGRELKGRSPCEDGGTSKFYLDARDCSRLAEAFAEMAKRLDDGEG